MSMNTIKWFTHELMQLCHSSVFSVLAGSLISIIRYRVTSLTVIRDHVTCLTVMRDHVTSLTVMRDHAFLILLFKKPH